MAEHGSGTLGPSPAAGHATNSGTSGHCVMTVWLTLYLSRVLLLVGHMTDELSLSRMTLLIQVMTPFCSHVTHMMDISESL